MKVTMKRLALFPLAALVLAAFASAPLGRFPASTIAFDSYPTGDAHDEMTASAARAAGFKRSARKKLQEAVRQVDWDEHTAGKKPIAGKYTGKGAAQALDWKQLGAGVGKTK